MYHLLVLHSLSMHKDRKCRYWPPNICAHRADFKLVWPISRNWAPRPKGPRASTCRVTIWNLFCNLREVYYGHGRNFVAKYGEDSLVWNQYIHLVDAKVKFYKYRFPIFFFRGVLKATLITHCFILLTSTFNRFKVKI